MFLEIDKKSIKSKIFFFFQGWLLKCRQAGWNSWTQRFVEIRKGNSFNFVLRVHSNNTWHFFGIFCPPCPHTHAVVRNVKFGAKTLKLKNKFKTFFLTLKGHSYTIHILRDTFLAFSDPPSPPPKKKKPGPLWHFIFRNNCFKTF